MAEVARVTRSKRQAQRAYDSMSGWYHLITDPFEGVYRRKGLDFLQPESGERLLEIGPGPGQALVSMANSIGGRGRIAGLDLSLGMLKQAERRLGQAGKLGSVWLAQGDGAQLPFRQSAFDGVFVSFTLELFDTPEIATVLDECRRVLKHGGRITIVSMAKHEESSVMTQAYLWFRQRFPNYADCRPIWVQQNLETAGFQVLDRSDFSMFGLPGAVLLAKKS